MDNYTVNNKQGVLCSSLLMKLCTFLILSLFAPKAFAQLDLIHYVPPFYAGTKYDADIGNHWVVLTTPSEEPITVTIKRGDGTLVATVANVSITTPKRYYFKNEQYGNTYGTIARPNLGIVNYTGLNKVHSNQGLIFTSENSGGKGVAFYVNIRHKSNIHGLSLTAKGQAALGTSFRSGHLHSVRGSATQNGWSPWSSYIVDHRSHFISVMATEDNTQVTFSDIKVGNLTSDAGTALSVAGITTDVATATSVSDFTDDGVFNVILNAGESYVLGANHEFLTPTDVNKFNGTKISSDKPIAVNSGSWCGSASTSNKQDIGVDQIVPEKLVGNEYILLRGQGNDGSERPVVVATKDGTNISVNGIVGFINPTPLNAGESYAIEKAHFTSEGTMLINTSENVYMYQTTAASVDKPYPTIGMNFIPPLSSLGFRQVDIPFINELGTGIVAIYSQNGADVYVNDVKLDQGTAKLVANKEEWVVYIYSTSDENVSVTSNKAIYVAMSVFDNVVGAAGYFSGFTKSISPIDTAIVFNHDLGYICSSQEGNIELAINSIPIPDWYEWYHDIVHLDSIKFKNENLLIPVPTEATKYILKAYFRDPNMDILYNGDFAIGRGSFSSSLDFFNIGQLTDPKKAVLTSNPKTINTSFTDFKDLDGVGKMLLAHSSGSGNADTIWQQTINSSTDIPGNLFVLKVYGRLAHEVDANYSEQLLDIYVNDEKVYTNFRLHETNTWNSVKAFWRAGSAETADIRIVDANASGKDAVFALDSITFVPALEATKDFNPDVVPSYTYTPYDQGLHLCEGTTLAYADISYGDMGWFDFEWKKKNDDGTYSLITDPSIEGLNTYKLTFNNVVDAHAGIYRCTIGFREDYEQCGIGAEPTSVLVEIFVDKPASLDPLAGKTELCEGTPTDVTATIYGEFSVIKWSVSNSTGLLETIESNSNVFTFNPDVPYYEAGVYTVKCEVVNGCSTDLFEEINIEILGKAKLEGLIIPTSLCEIKEITLEAKLEANYTPANSTLEYSWYKNGNSFMDDTFVSTYNITPDINDISYKVQVNTHYNFGLPTQFTCVAEPIEESLVDNPIDPEIKIIGLSPVSICEGLPQTYLVELETPSLSYTYTWDVPVGAQNGKVVPDDFNSSSFSLASVSLDMAGDYTVTVSNNCDDKSATSTLTVTPKLEVTGFSPSSVGPYCVDEVVTLTVTDNGHASAYYAVNLTKNITINPVNKSFDIIVNASTEGQWQVTALNPCGEKKTSEIPIYLADSFSAPTITDRGACVDGIATLVAVVETPPVGVSLIYQWKDQLGNDIVGETSSTLVFNPVKLADAGEYTCVVSDGICSTQQAKGTLNVDDVTTANLTPGSIDICEGLTHHFEVSFVGNPTFAWFFTGADDVKTDLSNSTSSYDTPSLDMADAGLYSCEITTGCGLKVFKQTLNILTNVTVTKDPAVVLDICEGEHTTLILNVTGSYASIKWYKNGTELTGELNKKVITTEDLGTSGTFEYKYIVDGSCDPVEGTFNVIVHEKPVLSTLDNNMEECAGLVELKVTESGEHNGISWWKNDVEITDGNAESTDFVINPAASPADDGTYIAKVSSDHCGDNQVSISLDIRNQIVVTDKSNPITTVCENEIVSLSVSADGDDIEFNWYNTAAPTVSLSDLPTLDLGSVSISAAGTYEVSLTNDLNCNNQILSFDLVVNKNPSVTNPDDKVICETIASVDFTVAGDAQGVANYQWFNNDGKIVGATNPTYTENAPEDGQAYYCEVTGTVGFCGKATSEKATLTIIQEVSVTDPLDLAIADGANASFSVIASGEPNYTYQWQENTGSGWNNLANGGKYSGVEQAKLEITGADKATFDGNQYRCVVGSTGAICASSATSNAATLTIADVTKIAVHPTGTTVCFNDNATISVEGTSAGLTYTWFYKKGAGVYETSNGNDGITVSLVGNVSTLTIPANDLDINNWKFQCVVSDGVSTDQTSNEVVVTVLEDIAVSTADASFTPCVDTPFSLSVTATAGDHIKYKWYKVGAEATILSTSATSNFGNIAVSDEGVYKCEIYNDQHCNDILRTFNIDVLEQATVIDPSDHIMCSTDPNPTFTVTAGGDGPFTYKWYNKAGVIAGAITDSYTETSPVDGEIYYCEVITACNTIQSKSVLLTVVQPISVTDPSDVTIADGANATFSVIASGEPNYSYQWQENDGSGWSDITDAGKYSGSSTSSLVISNALKADFEGNQYRCILNTDGVVCIPSVTSGIANLTINNVVKIAVQANDAEICFGDNAIISVEGTSDALTYVWEYNDGGGTFVNADGVASMSAAVAGKISTLTIPGNDLDINNWTFRCLVSDGVSTYEYSQIVKVKVLEDIAVTPGLLAHVLCENEALSMSVVATAGDDILYKWYKDTAPGTILSTNSIFNIGNVVLADEGNYTCEVYNLKACNDQTINFTLDVQEHVSTMDPADKTICSTDPNPVFTVVASGDAPYFYKWFNSAGEIAGAALASYTETAPVDGESYYCEVSNTCNTVVSKSADLVVVQPLAVTNPSNLTIADGGNAEFTVVASGEPNYTYQWQEDSGSGFVNITDDATYSGATTATLTISGADKLTFDTNQYQCIVDTDGLVCIPTVTSGIATLTVEDVDKILNQPTNAEVCFNDNATLSVEGEIAGLTYIWYYKKGAGAYETAIGKDGITVGLVGNVSTLTVPANDLDINNWKFQCTVDDLSSTEEYSAEVTITVLEDIAVSTVDASFTPCVDTPFSLSVTATAGDHIKYKWYKVGAEATILSTSATYNFGNIAVSDEGVYKCEIYNDQHCNDILRTFNIDVLELATVIDPSDHIMCSTDPNPVFTVTAGGDGPFAYKWYNKAGVIAGAVADSYTEASPVDGETYYCEVITTCNTIQSKSALLTVVQPISVTDPSDVTIADGANATFSVIASGEPNYSYQWQENDGSVWSDITDAGKYSGSNTSSLLITNALEADFNGNQYRCVLNTDGVVCIPTITSGNATLTINIIVKIAVQADDAEICFGDDATISVEGTRDALTYTWKYNDGSGTFVNADGVLLMSAVVAGKVSTLTIPGNDLDINNWTFRCLVSDALSTDEYSQIVTVKVLEDIAVTPGLLAHVLCENEALSMSVVATAGDDILYKWYKDIAPGTILSTNSTFNIGNVVLTDEGNYTCEVYNLKACNDQTINFTLDVKEHVTVSTLLDEEMCTSDTPPTFTVVASGDAPYFYKWFNSAGEIAGATLASYTVVAPVDGESYYCEVSNACNTIASNAAIITVNEEVTITTQPIALIIEDGADASFTVAASGEPVLIYQWQEDSGSGFVDITDNAVYSGANSSTLSITDADRATFNGNQYRCKVDNGCSVEQISAEVELTVNALIKIFAQPENLEVCLPNAAIFEIIGSTAGLTYEWKYSTDGVTYNTVAGVTEIDVTTDAAGSKLEIATTTLLMNTWTFQCIVKDGSSADETSNVVSLNVVEPVNFDALIAENLCFGDEKQISLTTVSGTGPISFSWSDGVSEVSTTADLSIGASDNGNYVVTASNGSVCPVKTDDVDVLHYSKLSLNVWANVDHVCIGTPEILSVSVDNFDPALTLLYKWYKDGDEIVGETKEDYNLAAADKSKTGLYKVEVYDGCSTEFVSGYVNVYEPIERVNNWNNEILCVGDNLFLEAKVTGDNPSYTWSLPATSTRVIGDVSDLNIDAILATDAGTYTCNIIGSCGTASYTVDISINDIPNITTDLDLSAVCVGEPLKLGPIVYDLTTNTTIDESIKWILPDGSTSLVTALELDLLTAEVAEEGNYRVEVSNVCGTDFSVGYQDVHPLPRLDPIDDQIVCQGENVIFKAVATGENLTYHWLVNGTIDNAFNDKSELIISDVQPDDVNTFGTYTVECRVSSCSTTRIETAMVTVNPNTILEKSIKGDVVYVGEDYEFELEVIGSNLVYEWRHINTAGDVNNLAETTKTLTISDLSLSDAGEYYCIITGDCGVRFTSGYLTVKDPIKLVSGLGTANIEKCFGEPLNLNISVEGEVFSIDWYKGTTDLNHHALNYSIPSLAVSDGGDYRCEIRGEGGSITENVNVTVYETTVLKSHLTDRTICELEDLQWIPNVSGSLLSYVWKRDGNPISNQIILEILNTPMDSAGVYSVDISGKCGNVSSEANLSLNKLPFFISKSDDVVVCENYDEIVFSVAYGGDNLEYQWQKDNTDIDGAKSSEFKLQNISVSDAGEYKCVVNSSCGLVKHSIMKLDVIPQLKILSESPGMEICDGEDAQFMIEVDGNDVVYQWKKDGLDLPGEIAPDLTINSASLTEVGYYSCAVTDKCTTTERYSNSKELTVNPLPSSKIFGRMTLCVLEDRVAYNTALTPDINYGWLVDGGEFTTPPEGDRTKITWGDVVEGSMISLEILNEATGCSSKLDSAVTLRPLPTVNLTALDTKGICAPEFEFQQGFPAGGIYWVDGVAQNTFDPGQGNGEYQVRYSYTDEYGCSNSTGELVMKIDSLPIVKIVEDVIVGTCETIQLSATTEEDNIRWSPGLYLDDRDSDTPIFTAGETTLYVATVVDKHGCVGNDIINVAVAPLPLITTINDTIIGECKEIQLTTIISGDIEAITWTNASDLDNPDNSNPKLINRQVGVNDYQINVTDKYGCVALGSVRVEVLPNPEIGEDQNLCEGETLLIDTKSLSNPIWSDGYTAWERTIDKPGEYELIVEQHDCELIQKIVMNPLPKFKLDNTVQPGIVIFEGQTVTLEPDLNPDYGPFVYDWSDGSVLSQLEVDESGVYKLKVEDNLGCIATDSVVVDVRPIGIKSPNAFTPLSGNENDRFYLKDINVTDKFEMYIYNRWGELMYKTNEAGYAKGWDGNYKGVACPIGAYVWVVMLDGKVKEKGNVILVR